MDEKTLRRLFQAREGAADLPGRRCPDEALLAAYVDGRIPDGKREHLESHLADCEACLGQVAFLASQPAELAAPAPPGAVARARDLVAPAPGPWRPLVLRWGSAVAGIACVVLVAAIVLRTPAAPQAPVAPPVPDVASAAPAQPAPRQPAPPPVASRPSQADQIAREAAPPAQAVRNSATSIHALSIVSPAEDATLARRDLEFRWQPVPASLYYEIDVVTDEGTVVWHARIEGTSARLPDVAKLDTGAKYFIWVKAFLTGGETVRSAAVSFHIAGQ